MSSRSGSTGHHAHWPQHSHLLGLPQCAARREAYASPSQSTRRGRSLLAKGARGGGGLPICAVMGGSGYRLKVRPHPSISNCHWLFLPTPYLFLKAKATIFVKKNMHSYAAGGHRPFWLPRHGPALQDPGPATQDPRGGWCLRVL
jgi:hypothetical protein